MCVCKGSSSVSRSKKEFSVFCSSSRTLYIAAVMSTNKADNICWRPGPCISRCTAAPLCHKVFPSWLQLSTFFAPFFQDPSIGFFFFFLLCLRERVKSKMFTEGDLCGDIFSFSLLEPGERPAENPSLWLRCTVVEQRVLTARTAVLSHPRVNANPRGTVAVARNDCLLLYTIV